MQIVVDPAECKDVETMRELNRHESNCQIIHDSLLPRGLAGPYLVQVNLLNWEDRSDVSRRRWTAKSEHKESNSGTPSLRVRQRSRLEWPLGR
jgi:hypothetical protein